MRSHEISESLAEIRQLLSRSHQLTGLDEERALLQEAIVAISVAEERLGRIHATELSMSRTRA